MCVGKCDTYVTGQETDMVVFIEWLGRESRRQWLSMEAGKERRVVPSRLTENIRTYL